MRRCVLLLAALAACQVASADRTPGKTPAPLPPGKQFEHDMMLRFHMHENFDLLRAIEKLLIRGRIDEARSLAKGIAQAPDERGMEPFAKRMIAVRDRAAALAAATSVDEALRQEAKLARACGDCHTDAAVLPELTEAPRPPPDKPTLPARMARHLWATDRLWEGVIADSDEAWRAGADVLAATPLPWPDAAGDRVALGKQLQRLADQARRADATVSDKPGERARQYGEILATCAACHTGLK